MRDRGERVRGNTIYKVWHLSEMRYSDIAISFPPQLNFPNIATNTHTH